MDLTEFRGSTTMRNIRSPDCKLTLNNLKANYIGYYYINTNEIPGELSRENLISSHVKISPLLWLHNKLRLSYQKTIKVKWFGISLVFI